MEINEKQYRALRLAAQNADLSTPVQATVLNADDRRIVLRKVALQVSAIFLVSGFLAVGLLLFFALDAPGRSIADEPSYLILGVIVLGGVGFALGHWMGVLKYPSNDDTNRNLRYISSEIEGLVWINTDGVKQAVKWEQLKVLEVAITSTQYGPFLRRIILAADEGLAEPVLLTIDPILLTEGDRIMAAIAMQLLTRMNES